MFNPDFSSEIQVGQLVCYCLRAAFFQLLFVEAQE